MQRRTLTRSLALAVSLAAPLGASAGFAAPSPAVVGDAAVPRYAHVFVVVEENKDYAEILGGPYAPAIGRLAKSYGNATHFYGEVHPSEGNYVALVGGDTYGIHDDDAFYCAPGSIDVKCPNAVVQPGYRTHTIDAPHLGSQLEAAGLTWKGYYESLPAPGSTALTATDPAYDSGTKKTALYASKHSGFLNFASVQNDPHRADHLVGFDRLDSDLASGAVPSFALVVPNQCNDMHGLTGPKVPADCDHANVPPLIGRGDRALESLVAKIQRSSVWKSAENVAIVVTFDEDASDGREGCCGVEPASLGNFGGGHIPTIVVTNHGPRGVSDPTPYNHYSLLRTLEDAFGIREYLGHAADVAKGVRSMTPLFRTR
jgi:hypothetical protein